MKTILITGGAGFIGSNFVIHLLNKYKNYRIVNLDKLTYAGSLDNITEVSNNPNHIFIEGDINDKALLEKLFIEYQFDGLVHFAAESHVDNSIEGPEAFIQTNINGTFNLLEAARKHWIKAPFESKDGFKDARFHHISTDEVYGTLGETGYFTEKAPYAPNSPYSASKAASDMLVRSYFHTYGLNVVTTNCSNNYGPKQHKEKLIPTIIRKALSSEPIPIYGDGKNIRDWLYVHDHCVGIDLVFHKGKRGETYNIGGNNEKTNIEVAETICAALDKLKPRADNTPYKDLITFVKDRPGHDKRYAIDASKINTELGWNHKQSFENDILTTVKWYLEKNNNI